MSKKRERDQNQKNKKNRERRRLMLSKSEAGHPKRFHIEKRDINWLRMRTMQGVCLVTLDTGEATVNGTKETRSSSSRRPDRKLGTGMTFLGTVSNARETLEVANWALDKRRQNEMRIEKEAKRMDLPSPL